MKFAQIQINSYTMKNHWGAYIPKYVGNTCCTEKNTSSDSHVKFAISCKSLNPQHARKKQKIIINVDIQSSWS